MNAKPTKPRRGKQGPFDAPDDAALCDDVSRALSALDDEFDVARMEEHERVVSLVWLAVGLVGNGGFEYLLGATIEGDPGFVHTAAAFEAIGAGTAHRALQDALACFPGSRPHAELEARRAHYAALPDATRDPIDQAFRDGRNETEARLATWIRAHRAALEARLAGG